MGKKIKITLIIILMIIIGIITGITINIHHKNKIQEENKIKAQKRYEEIKSDINKELERYIYVMYPMCQANIGTLITHKDLVYHAGMDKEKFLDVDEKSYCKAYIDAKCVETGKWEWDVTISCKDYEDEGYIEWVKGFNPKK